MRRAILVCLTLSSLALAQADRERATAAQLETLKAEIATIQARIAEQTASRDDVQRTLRDTELEIAANDRALRQLGQRIDALEDKLIDLDRKAFELEDQRKALETRMIDELRHLWSLQQGGGLRVLLGDQGPDKTVLNLAYYRRLIGARNEAITAYETLLAEIDDNRAAELSAQQQLTNEQAALLAEQTKARALASQRQRTLATIEQTLSADSNRVEKLKADSAQLTALLEELRSSLAALDTPASYKPFDKARGEFVFPAAGKPRNRFGATRNAGNLRWRGWLIPAQEGSEVRAIHHGRVVYSDWLRGQGLLTIIDHGEGWLSLYGHNRSLQAEVGDWVAPGDIIARVGASGGATAPALYFEIRKDGTPVNPADWLQR